MLAAVKSQQLRRVSMQWTMMPLPDRRALRCAAGSNMYFGTSLLQRNKGRGQWFGRRRTPVSTEHARQESRRTLVTVIALGVLLGCQDGSSVVTTAPQTATSLQAGDSGVVPGQFSGALRAAAVAEIAAAVGGRNERGFEDDILRIEAKVPGVGGVFLDSTRTSLVVWVRDPSSDAAARAAVGALAAGQVSTLSPFLLVKSVRVQRGQFAFSELVAGHRALSVRPNAKVVTLDANEATNKISIGVLDSLGLNQVFADARSLGVPDSALDVTIARAPRLTTDLTGTFRPTMGGVLVRPVYGTPIDAFACSLGWNVTRADSSQTIQYFITAAHCLKEYLQTDCGPSCVGSGLDQYQPGTAASNAAGTLSYVPRWNEAGCDGAHGSLCTSSDVMQYRYYVTVPSSKVVAKTAYVGTSSSPGSTNQVGTLSSTGLTIAVVNNTIDKVGVASGWTRGTVAATCETVYFDISNRPIDGQNWEGHKCMFRTVGSEDWTGDSGGPAFTPPSLDRIGTIGIMIGDQQGLISGSCSSPCYAWGTDWSHIEAALQMPYGGGLVPY